MPVEVKVTASLLLVAVVLWWVWRLPRSGDRWFGWGPVLALLSAWTGLASLGVAGAVWLVPVGRNWMLAALFLLLCPASMASGLLLRWIYRGMTAGGRPVNLETDPVVDAPDSVAMHRLQANVGMVLTALAIAAGYAFVLLRAMPGDGG